MVNKKGVGGFKPLNEAQLGALRAAAANPKNVSYLDIAKAANLPKSTVIKYVVDLGLRPKGNLVSERQVKQPKLAERLKTREAAMESFILEQVLHSNPVGVNLLISRFGGTKKFASMVLKSVEAKLHAKNVSIKRLSVADQAHGKKSLVGELGVPLSSIKGRRRLR